MQIKTNSFLRVLFVPMIKFCDYLGRKHPLILTQLRYFMRFHRFIDFDNPRDLNEKIQWLKLKKDISEWSRLSDKYAVREYVKEQGCGENLVSLYGRWNNVEEIDFDRLPDSFVLKANNGCGSVILVKDKNGCDWGKIKNTLNEWISKPFGADGGEIQYLSIKPCVIAEELLTLDDEVKKYSTSLVDYKVWCFNGTPQYIMTCSNRSKEGVELQVYDLEWNVVPNSLKSNGVDKIGSVMPKPKRLTDILCVAKKLARPFPCVRVDLYYTSGKVYFGEMTFTSFGGMMNYYTPEFLSQTGAMIDLNYKG